MKRFHRCLAMVLVLALLLPLSAAADAAAPTPFALSVRVEGGRSGTVRCYDEGYPGNLYLSLSDLSQLLRGSTKQFRFEYVGSGDYFAVTTGASPGAAITDAPTRARDGAAYLDITRPRIFLNGSERRYYCYRDGNRDLFMNLTDVQLLLDLTAQTDWPDAVVLQPDVPFAPDVEQLRREGYFDAINAIVLGDADTGEILFSTDPFKAYPIASLSKLMTYLLLRECEWNGELHFTDTVTITEEADRISRSADGMISMNAYSTVPFQELVEGMLLCSSNEAAASLAAYATGSTEIFVEHMNERARELSLFSARFYTPHGLPVYSSYSVSAKMQNKMSAMDMFELCAYILRNDPQITAVTSKPLATLPTLKYSAYNTNTLIYNVPGVTGLKTGSTNRAGYCVTVSLPVTRDGQTHNLVLVILGAETPDLRGQAGEILLHWAQDYYTVHPFRDSQN